MTAAVQVLAAALAASLAPACPQFAREAATHAQVLRAQTLPESTPLASEQELGLASAELNCRREYRENLTATPTRLPVSGGQLGARVLRWGVLTLPERYPHAGFAAGPFTSLPPPRPR